MLQWYIYSHPPYQNHYRLQSGLNEAANDMHDKSWSSVMISRGDKTVNAKVKISNYITGCQYRWKLTIRYTLTTVSAKDTPKQTQSQLFPFSCSRQELKLHTSKISTILTLHQDLLWRCLYCLTIIGCNFVSNMLHKTLISYNGPWFIFLFMHIWWNHCDIIRFRGKFNFFDNKRAIGAKFGTLGTAYIFIFKSSITHPW